MILMAWSGHLLKMCEVLMDINNESYSSDIRIIDDWYWYLLLFVTIGDIIIVVAAYSMMWLTMAMLLMLASYSAASQSDGVSMALIVYWLCDVTKRPYWRNDGIDDDHIGQSIDWYYYCDGVMKTDDIGYIIVCMAFEEETAVTEMKDLVLFIVLLCDNV